MQGIFSKLSSAASTETPVPTTAAAAPTTPATTSTAPATKAGLTTTPAATKAPPKSAPTTEAPAKAEGAAKPVVAAEQMGVQKPIEQKPSEEKKSSAKGGNGSPSTGEPSAVPQPGKATALLGEMPNAVSTAAAGSAAPAKAAAGASAAATAGGSTAKAPPAAPTSAAAVVGPGVKGISAMERASATGSVLARGPGAKAEAPKAAAKAEPKSGMASAPPKATATSLSKAPAAPPAAASSAPASVAPASVLKIVTGKPDPALATQADAMPTGTMGPARTLTQAAAPALKALKSEGPGTETIPTEGPPAVAVGRALAAGKCVTPAAAPGKKPMVPIGRKYQIVFVTGEVAPYSKTGGLGEAMDGLPIAMAALGHRVMVISPRYDQYEDAWDTGFWSSVNMGGKEESVHFFHAYKQKVDKVFVDHPAFLERVNGKSGAKLYGPEWGKDFADNQARFAYFCKAALIAIKELPLGGFTYGANTIVVANDWHSALVPMFIHHEKASQPGSWGSTKSFFLCHNAVFQGRFEREEGLDEVFGVPASYIDSITFKMPLRVGKYNKKTMVVNTMAAGLRYVDRVLTVSPSYAAECAADPEKGVELEQFFALGNVTGILNGVKEGVSPFNKNFVTKTKMSCGTFDASTVDVAKEELKVAYRKESGLPESEGPLLCFIGRLDAQKGYDLLLEALVEVLEDAEVQVVVVGAGRDDLVALTRAVEKKFPKKFYYAGWMGPERYALLGGCDYTLLPSRWEPCGLVQMEAMRLGTLPIVAPTGGLKDTVEDGVNGIWMDCEMTVEAELDEESSASIARALRRAVEIHTATPGVESTMKKAAMAAAAEFTWSNAALQYEQIFEEVGAVDVMAGNAGAVSLEVDKEVC